MERILEHIKRTTWRGGIAVASRSGYARQTLCGDEVWIDVAVEDAIISQARYRGQGCAVSMGCASMLCEAVEGQRVERVLAETAEELLDFPVGQLSMSKQRCAILGWEALRMALLSDANTTNSVEPPAVAELSDSTGMDSPSLSDNSPPSQGIPP